MKHDRLPSDMDPADLNFPETLRLTVESPTAARDEAQEAAAAADGEKKEAVRTFADVTAFRRLLTPRRVEVLQSIIDDAPDSIQALADRLGRNYPEIHEDVEILADYGIVYYREQGRAKAPYIPYKRIEIEGTVAEAVPAA